MQQGGVIYAHQAGAVVSKKQELDTRKKVEKREWELQQLIKKHYGNGKDLEAYFPRTEEI